MSEFDLLAKLRARLGTAGDRVVIGSGDDAAVVRADGAVSVTSVDAFVEGVHFRLATTSMRDLGHKCLAASLSDLAAMGAGPGRPTSRWACRSTSASARCSSWPTARRRSRASTTSRSAAAT